MKIHSPANISVLLHCHCMTDDIPYKDTPAGDDAIATFTNLGCIEFDSETRCYKTTPKGAAWVTALCNVEEPRECYVDSAGNILS